VQILVSEELLVYLCLHGSVHAWQRLEWVCGVAELLRSGGLGDWGRAYACAHRFDAERRLHAGVLIARVLLDAPMPVGMRKPDMWTRAAVRSVVRRFTDDADGKRDSASVRVFIYQLRTDDGAMARAARCWTTLLAPHVADMMIVPLPRVLWPLYYILRPLRLAWRYGLGLLWRRG
jgi:hypothetical protein